LRTLTLLFFSVVSLLAGAVAMAPAAVAIAIYRQQGDSALAFGVYGYLVAVIALAAPFAFFVAAVLSAFERK
jgi:hypothetical protein